MDIPEFEEIRESPWREHRDTLYESHVGKVRIRADNVLRARLDRAVDDRVII